MDYRDLSARQERSSLAQEEARKATPHALQNRLCRASHRAAPLGAALGRYHHVTTVPRNSSLARSPLLACLPSLSSRQMHQERLKLHVSQHIRHRLFVLGRAVLSEWQERVHFFVRQAQLTETQRALLAPLSPLHDALQVIPVSALRLGDWIVVTELVETDAAHVLFFLLRCNYRDARTDIARISRMAVLRAVASVDGVGRMRSPGWRLPFPSPHLLPHLFPHLSLLWPLSRARDRRLSCFVVIPRFSSGLIASDRFHVH